MTIKDKMGFTIDGIPSEQLKVFHVSTEEGFFEEQLGAEREIVEDVNQRSNKRFFKRVSEEALTIPFVVAWQGKLEDKEIKEIVRAFSKKKYVSLTFEGSDRVYMVLSVGERTMNHIGTNEGYMSFTLRCDGSHKYSEPIISEHDLTSEIAFSINNDGDVPVTLEFSFKASSDGDLEIVREGYTVKITKLRTGETILVNTDINMVFSDAIGNPNKYPDVVGELEKLNIEEGVQNYSFKGKGKLTIAYQKKYEF